MKAVLEAAVRGLVDEPDRVRVTERRSEDGEVCLEIDVARADRGCVIGKRGRTADALRTLLSAVAQLRGERCRVDVL